MKKKAISILLALLLTLGAMTASGLAAGSFSDVTDQTTQRNVEVLRMLGVVSGDGTGHFHPNDTLTRAEFCKMAVVMLGSEDRAEHFRSVTIFPDVRAASWASGYINLAVREAKLIAGNPDGTFAPNRAITFGEAVTILSRILGYTDADSGAVWPAGYLALGRTSGLTEGLTLSGSAVLNRAQSAQLFVNLLYAEKKAGGEYLPPAFTRESETKLLSVSGTKLRVSSAAKSTYETEKEQNGSPLVGLTGYVITRTDSGKAVAFLPKVVNGTTALPDSAVIVPQDGSTVGFSALSGDRSDYTIYKNGIKVTAAALRRNDVATYDAAANMITVCDTRINVYYESCSPNTSEPVTITALGHSFPVLAVAHQSISAFKPGEQITLLLTADGQVAAALALNSGAKGNAVGRVKDGTVFLLCGSEWVELSGCRPASGTSLSELEGKLVGISSVRKDYANLSAKSSSGKYALSVSKKLLGAMPLAENVQFFDCGEPVELSDYNRETIPAERISFYRTNWDGAVDLIATDTGISGTVLYGLVKEVEVETEGYGDMKYSVRTITLDAGGKTVSRESGYDSQSGRFVEVVDNGERFIRLTELKKLAKVSAKNWIGDSAVTYGGQTYEVPDSVLCYNADSRTWVTAEEAKDYSDALNLYVSDGIVRIIEVKT